MPHPPADPPSGSLKQSFELKHNDCYLNEAVQANTVGIATPTPHTHGGTL